MGDETCEGPKCESGVGTLGKAIKRRRTTSLHIRIIHNGYIVDYDRGEHYCASPEKAGELVQDILTREKQVEEVEIVSEE